MTQAFADPADISYLQQHARRIALLGASSNTVRPSYRVMQFLLKRGFKVLPVNPGLAGQLIQGCEVYACLRDVPGPIDMVDVFRQSCHVQGIVNEMIDLGIPALWTQLGVVDNRAAERAKRQGIRVVMDRCPAIEWC